MSEIIKPIVICLIGPPASGKGTQARLLAKTLTIPQVTLGHILRRISQENSTDGRRLRDIINHGVAISAEILRPVFDDVLHEYAKSDVIIDGFPRTREQAELLVAYKDRIKHLVVVEIALSDKEVVARAKARLAQPGYTPQIDDDLEIVDDKLLLYNASKKIIEKTLLSHWSKGGKHMSYVQVDGSKDINELQHAITDFVKKDIHL